MSVLRRRALLLQGLHTYTFGKREGHDSILCLCCGLGSTGAGDIGNRYCGFCGVFHDDPFKVEVARPLDGALLTLEELTQALDERGLWRWESAAGRLRLWAKGGAVYVDKPTLREAAEEVLERVSS